MAEYNTLKCRHCDQAMPPARRPMAVKIYCGEKCRDNARNARRRWVKTERKQRAAKRFYDHTCTMCGIPFRAEAPYRTKCSFVCGTRQVDPKHPAALLDAEYLRTRLDYDLRSGVFTWLPRRGESPQEISWNAKYAGKQAGTFRRTGRVITVDLIPYRAARLAWLFVTGRWPEVLIDHRDVDPTNDSFDNLREANFPQNGANRRPTRTTLKGAYLHSANNGWWQATLKRNGKNVYLGRYRTEQEAHQAYLAAALEAHGDYVRTE